MEHAIGQFKSCRLTPFRAPGEIYGDMAFDNRVFASYLVRLGIGFRPVPPRRHVKNPPDSKHRIIHEFFKLKCANPT